MVVLAIVYMFNFVDRQILAILLPAIRDEFQVSDTFLGMLSGTAFALFYATGFRGAEDILEQPRLMEWLARMRPYVTGKPELVPAVVRRRELP